MQSCCLPPPPSISLWECQVHTRLGTALRENTTNFRHSFSCTHIHSQLVFLPLSHTIVLMTCVWGRFDFDGFIMPFYHACFKLLATPVAFVRAKRQDAYFVNKQIRCGRSLEILFCFWSESVPEESMPVRRVQKEVAWCEAILNINRRYILQLPHCTIMDQRRRRETRKPTTAWGGGGDSGPLAHFCPIRRRICFVNLR